MKINHFAVIPANVRYDKYLSDKSKLLWGEIAASANTYGVTEEDNGYFASILNVDRRTIIRCLNQLIDNGHVIRLEEKKRRKLKVVIRVLPLPDDSKAEVTHEVDMESILEFANRFLSLWEMKTKSEIQDKDSYIPILKKRLVTFSEGELLEALENRVRFIHQSTWHMNPENASTALSIDAVIMDDEDVLNWLKAK